MARTHLLPDVPDTRVAGDIIAPNGEPQGNIKYGFNFLCNKINLIIQFINSLDDDVVKNVRFEKVAEVPDPEEAELNVIYLVPKENPTSTDNKYDEYYLVEEGTEPSITKRMEKVGPDLQFATKVLAGIVKLDGFSILGDENGTISTPAMNAYIKRSTAYSLDDTVYSTQLPAGKLLKCTQAGTTSAVEPVIIGDEVIDGTAKFSVSEMGGGNTGQRSMYAISGYRYLPFEDRLSSVQVVERYTIPSGDNPLVLLKQIPEKTVPTSIVIKEIISLDSGEPIYGDTFTEMDASPLAKCYYPDYYTGADNDPRWNTGLLMFNSADSGKMIEVTYNSIGSLATNDTGGGGIEWQTDRGDGRDGAFNPTSNVTLSGTFYNFASVNIPSGVTVTIANGGYIKCLGTFTNNGVITANGRGASGGGGGSGDRHGTANPGGGGGNGDASNGGNGGSGYYYDYRYGSHSVAGGAGGRQSRPVSDTECENSPLYNYFGSGGGGGGGYFAEGPDDPPEYGSGGGGGAGGGAIVIVATTITNNGTITANGNGGAGGGTGAGTGGGGGGGLIQLVADTVTQGTLTVAGTGGGTAGKIWIKRLA